MFIVARTAEAGAEKTEPAFLCIDAITGVRASKKAVALTGKTPAYVHHRKNSEARAEKSAAGF